MLIPSFTEKRAKAMTMQQSGKGDEVVHDGGLIGKIKKLTICD